MNPVIKANHTRVGWPVVLLAAWIALTACAGTRDTLQTDSGGGQKSLDAWVDNTLIPYLIQQFDRHPRFRSEQVLLVRMQGENVSPRIDELTEQIRHRIIDAVLTQPGIELAWRPSARTWLHHQSLEDISCGQYNDVHYYVGIDAGLAHADRQLYVKVRALNLAENKWVSGFGRSWQGRPTAEQLEALGREHADEYLRGLRPLPFSNRQPDMLAAYLARNLSCLLKQGEADALVVHVTEPDVNSPKTFRTALDLVGRYLARFREVEVTDDSTQANVTIVAAIHSIDRNLHQVWIAARRRQGDKYLPGAGTEAYITLETSNEKPINTAGVSVNTVSPVPLQPLQDNSGPFQLISSFELLTPHDQRYCVNGAAWRSGVKRVDSRDLLPTGSCLAIELEIPVPAYIFLLGQDSAGDLSRIYPTDCDSLGRPVARRHPEGLFRFPAGSGPHAGVLQIGGAPGMESIYAIVITAAGLAGRFDNSLEHIQGLCRTGADYPEFLLFRSLRFRHERVQRWQNYLTWLADNHPGMIGWREIRFRHADL